MTFKNQKIRNFKPKVVIIGSRGIPPRYGGAETFVYELSKRLKEVFEVYVTCETNRFSVDEFEGIKRVHVPAYHTPTITIPSVYDVIATLYVLKKVKDAQVFYYITPDGALAAIFAKLAGKKVLVNTDGIEWRRPLKRMRFVPWYLKPLYLFTAMYMLLMEFLACKISHVTIADSLAIKKYLVRRWKPSKVVYIAYGIRKLPEVEENEARELLSKFMLEPYTYFLTIGRIVAENNIHLEIEAFRKTNTNKKLVIVGPIDPQDPYVKYLFKLKRKDKRIIFTGPIYDLKLLSALRKYCLAYIHPYTVGGTNPSLLEQLQYNRPVIAMNIPYNKEVLKDKAEYFNSQDELLRIMNMNMKQTKQVYEHAEERFNWDRICSTYIKIISSILREK